MTVQIHGRIIENPCEQYRDIIRESFVQILSKARFPISARLFSMACFANETDLFLYPGNPGFSEDMIAEEINRVAGHVYERLWLEEFQKKEMNLELPMSMIQSLFLDMILKCGPEFREMILAAWAEYILEEREDQKERSGRDKQEAQDAGISSQKPVKKVLNIFDIEHSGSKIHVMCSSITGSYQKRRKYLYQLLGPELEGQIEHFCIRFVLSTDHTGYGSLFAYVQRLVLDVALMKYFMVSDPGLTDAVRRVGANRASILHVWEKERQVLEKAVADFARRYSDNAAREESSIIELSRFLSEHGMQNIANTSLMIQF
jgi:hypothetical protein